MSIKLYGSYTSPYVRHCRLALKESGLDWSFIETDAKASASQSPTQKVPFLEDGDIRLCDSAAIIRYIREKSGQSFCPKVQDFDLFCTANTLLDACVNVFLLERADKRLADNPYLNRQRARMHTGFDYLETLPLSSGAPYHDGELRLACLLDWGLYRERFTLDKHPKLKDFLDQARGYTHIQTTRPPADG